jgi:uncharacterized protein YigA (DUF484 family)
VNTSSGVQGITESDIAEYLANTPGFFERHAELMSTIQLTSPHGNRAVSLQERQMEMLRERIKGLERKIMDMVRSGQENVAIADRLHRWTRSLLLTQAPADLPGVLLEELKMEFMIPQAGMRLWDIDMGFIGRTFTRPVSEDARSFATSLPVPYCGLNSGFEAVRWLDDPGEVRSLAMIPLRNGEQSPAFGLIILASPEVTRFAPGLGLEFLQRIGELSSAALTRLLPAL